MAVSSFVSIYSCLYAFVMNQFTEGNIKELQSFLLPIRNCMNGIEQGTATNERYRTVSGKSS